MTIFYGIILLLILIYLVSEYILLSIRIRKIPYRIFVNGTRGKSTTVRLIHEIFVASRRSAYARTTGDQIKEYYPDGDSRIKKRLAPANIIENVRLLYKWTRKKPEVIILECMAIQPELQSVLARIFQPTHVIFTNFLPDHFESMGADLSQIRQSLLRCIYPMAKVIMPAREMEYFDSSIKSKINLEIFNPRSLHWNFDNIPPEIINDSWGLISYLCSIFNISHKKASVGFHRVWESVNKNVFIENDLKRYSLINLFSVNDPHSTRIFVSFFMTRGHSTSNNIIILNTRRDRPLRTLHFLYLIRDLYSGVPIWITGGGRYLAFILAKKLSVQNPIRIRSIQNLITEFVTGYDKPVRIFGFANFKGAAPLIDLQKRKI